MFGVSRYKLLYVKQMSSKVLLYGTRNYIQYPVIEHNGTQPMQLSSVRFSSVQSLSRVRLCDPMNRSTPGLPVHH